MDKSYRTLFFETPRTRVLKRYLAQNYSNKLWFR